MCNYILDMDIVQNQNKNNHIVDKLLIYTERSKGEIMGKIVAIGGGELGLGETNRIDSFIVDLIEKENPNLLFIPTASNDNVYYINSVKDYFLKYGCVVDSLNLVATSMTNEEIEEKIVLSDIIYVGGGDTNYMLDIWREHKLEKLLVEAFDRGVVLSGLSAGAICWFDFGHYDDDLSTNSGYWDKQKPKGLGLIKGALCPHFNYETHGKFNEVIKINRTDGIALEDKTALVLLDDELSIIKSDENMKAFKFNYDENNQTVEEMHENHCITEKLK